MADSVYNSPEFQNLVQTYGLRVNPNNSNDWIFIPRNQQERENQTSIINQINNNASRVKDLPRQFKVSIRDEMPEKENTSNTRPVGTGAGAPSQQTQQERQDAANPDDVFYRSKEWQDYAKEKHLTQNPNNPNEWIRMAQSANERDNITMIADNIMNNAYMVFRDSLPRDFRVAPKDNPDISWSDTRHQQIQHEANETNRDPTSKRISVFNPETGEFEYRDPKKSKSKKGDPNDIPPEPKTDLGKQSRDPNFQIDPFRGYRTALGTSVSDRDEAGEFTARDRAGNAQEDVRARSGIDMRKTPEELRTEHFQRLADIENNRQYWDPSVMRIGAGTGAQQISEGGAVQRPQIEFEDMRQQMINRARRGDMAAYQQLGRMKEANDVLYKIRTGGELDQSDLEKIRVNDQYQIAKMMGVNEAQLDAAMREVESNVKYDAALNEAAAEMQISKQQLLLTIFYMQSVGVREGMMLGERLGLSSPELAQVLVSLPAEKLLYSGAYGRMQKAMGGETGQGIGTTPSQTQRQVIQR